MCVCVCVGGGMTNEKGRQKCGFTGSRQYHVKLYSDLLRAEMRRHFIALDSQQKGANFCIRGSRLQGPC